VPDGAIRDVGIRRFSEASGNVGWLDVARDRSAAPSGEGPDR
jgi:hypothetical protein